MFLEKKEMENIKVKWCGRPVKNRKRGKTQINQKVELYEKLDSNCSRGKKSKKW